MSYLIEIKLETKDSNKATPEIIQEIEVPIFDFIEKNTFVPIMYYPYSLLNFCYDPWHACLVDWKRK